MSTIRSAAVFFISLLFRKGIWVFTRAAACLIFVFALLVPESLRFTDVTFAFPLLFSWFQKHPPAVACLPDLPFRRMTRNRQ